MLVNILKLNQHLSLNLVLQFLIFFYINRTNRKRNVGKCRKPNLHANYDDNPQIVVSLFGLGFNEIVVEQVDTLIVSIDLRFQLMIAEQLIKLVKDASQNAAIDGAVAFHRNKRGLTRFWCRPLLQFMTLSASCLTRRNGNVCLSQNNFGDRLLIFLVNYYA